jgi:hypothetical protein
MKLKGSCHCQAVHFEVDSYTPYPFMYCYCSICRKTDGGGGYAINIMGQADTLKVTGAKNIKIYHAKMPDGSRSSGRRRFCKQCGSCLWIDDPSWPQWIYPFASAIDTPLPKAPERIHMMLEFAASWCRIPRGKNDIHINLYPKDSIEKWHKRHKLYKKL